MLLHIVAKKLDHQQQVGQIENTINIVGQLSPIIRTLTSKDSDLISHFDKINESQD